MALADGDALVIVWWRWRPLSMTRMLRFDAATHTWAELGEPFVSSDVPEGQPARTWGVDPQRGFVVPLADGRVLFGDGRGDDGDRERSADLFDPASGTWASLPPMPTGRHSATPVALADGSALLVGGSRSASDPMIDRPELVADALRFVPGD